MAITTLIRGRILLLVSLLLLATATRKVVGAKVVVSTSSNNNSNNNNNNDVLLSSFGLAGRSLQDEGNNLEEVLNDNSGKDDSDSDNTNVNDNDNDIEYAPHLKGTAVQYQDQDGTWMLGVIWKYNDDTQTYTIQWDEDNIEEYFPDVNEVDQLVRNAEMYNNFPMNDAREQQEDNGSQGDVPQNFDFDFTYQYEDLTDYDPWPIGTQTLLEFADGWYEGEITSFSMSDDKKNATYVVTWSDGASDSFANKLEWMDLMVANAIDYEPWELGTPAFGYPNPDGGDGQESENTYLSGEITAFENGAYTVIWSNGDSVVYNDFDMVDQLVNNAGVNMDGASWLGSYDPYPKGTIVAWDFDDGWWDGSVTDFSNGAYEVTWSDGSSKYYSNLEKIDQMVNFANGGSFIGNLADPEDADYMENDDNIYGDYYALETLVYAEFKDGWWAGYIDSYEGDFYVVRWSDDSVDKFLPNEEMDEMVLNGQYIPQDYGIYAVGTHVYKEFDGIWFWGTVEYSEGGFYTILWDDGTRTTYVSGTEIDEMVKNANKSGMSPFDTFALIIFVLGSVGGIVFFGLRRKKKQQLAALTEQVKENELVLRERNDNEYSDQPAEGGTPGLV